MQSGAPPLQTTRKMRAMMFSTTTLDKTRKVWRVRTHHQKEVAPQCCRAASRSPPSETGAPAAAPKHSDGVCEWDVRICSKFLRRADAEGLSHAHSGVCGAKKIDGQARTLRSSVVTINRSSVITCKFLLVCEPIYKFGLFSDDSAELPMFNKKVVTVPS